MRNDVHFAALRAAAKVAFSIASVGLVGCSAEADPGDETASNESNLASKDEAKAPCPDALPTKPSCEAVLASTFPVPGN